jgi:hypothetical protein
VNVELAGIEAGAAFVVGDRRIEQDRVHHPDDRNANQTKEGGEPEDRDPVTPLDACRFA